MYWNREEACRYLIQSAQVCTNRKARRAILRIAVMCLEEPPLHALLHIYSLGDKLKPVNPTLAAFIQKDTLAVMMNLTENATEYKALQEACGILCANEHCGIDATDEYARTPGFLTDILDGNMEKLVAIIATRLTYDDGVVSAMTAKEQSDLVMAAFAFQKIIKWAASK